MDDQRDYAEEQYNRDLCPGCDCSPCDDPDECARVIAAEAARVESSYLRGL